MSSMLEHHPVDNPTPPSRRPILSFPSTSHFLGDDANSGRSCRDVPPGGICAVPSGGTEPGRNGAFWLYMEYVFGAKLWLWLSLLSPDETLGP